MKTRAFLAIFILGLLLRLFVVFRTDFPMNQGGMFYVMVEDLIANGFRLPLYTTYNHADIPFAYSPLGFYLAGFLTVFFKIPLLALLKIIPFVFSTGSVLVYYLFSKRILKSSSAALIAMFLYIGSVSAYMTQVEGASITRAPALMMGLLALTAVYDLCHEKSWRKTVLAAFFLGFTALFHLETAVFVVYSIAALYIVYGRTARGAVQIASVGIGALLISAPWWITVVVNHGLQPFLAAQQSRPWVIMGGLDLQQISLMRYFANPLFDPFPTLAFLGGIICIARRQWFLPFWFTLLLATGLRLFLTTTGIIPIGMMAGYALHTVILPGLLKLIKPIAAHGVSVPATRAKTGFYLMSAVFVLACFFTIFWHSFTPFQALSPGDRSSMAWVKRHTRPTDTFLIITPVPHWAWFLDPVSEWFPAVADRHSVLTIQGYEWVPGFNRRLTVLERIKRCTHRDIGCLEREAQDAGLDYTHIYIAKPFELEPDIAACCHILAESLAHTPTYTRVFDSDRALIYEKSSITR